MGPKRRVTAYPNRQGQITLGPLRDAFGLGDTLTVTPCAAAIPNAVMQMPAKMQALAPLFDGLCPVEITEDFPVFPMCNGKSVTDSNLSMCGIHSVGALPVVRITPEETRAARLTLASCAHPVALVPTCSKAWAHIRGRSPDFFKPIVETLAARRTVIQFGFADYPDLPGTIRMPFKDFRHLAALYSEIGLYVGLNTGDYHLMIAAGGKAVVIEPPRDAMGYNPRMWRYNQPDRVRYVDPATPEAVIDALSLFDQ